MVKKITFSLSNPSNVLELVVSVCKIRMMYTPNGTFYECALYLEGRVTCAPPGTLGQFDGHNPFLAFINWAIVKRKGALPNEFTGWRYFRGLFNSDDEALEEFPLLLKEYLEEQGLIGPK